MYQLILLGAEIDVFDVSYELSKLQIWGSEKKNWPIASLRSSEVKNEWSCNSIFLVRLHDLGWWKFNFTLLAGVHTFSKKLEATSNLQLA